MSNKETLRILQAFAENQRKTINDLGVTVESINGIADNLTIITTNIRLLLWKMEVLVYPVLLKDIYNLTQEEWMDLTTEQVIEMVEAIDHAPE